MDSHGEISFSRQRAIHTAYGSRPRSSSNRAFLTPLLREFLLRRFLPILQLPNRIPHLAAVASLHRVGTEKKMRHRGVRVLINERVKFFEVHLLRRSRAEEMAVVFVNYERGPCRSGSAPTRGGRNRAAVVKAASKLLLMAQFLSMASFNGRLSTIPSILPSAGRGRIVGKRGLHPRPRRGGEGRVRGRWCKSPGIIHRRPRVASDRPQAVIIGLHALDPIMGVRHRAVCVNAVAHFLIYPSDGRNSSPLFLSFRASAASSFLCSLLWPGWFTRLCIWNGSVRLSKSNHGPVRSRT